MHRLILALILVAGFALRIWNIDYGLPFVYSIDEGSHFANRAVQMFWQDFDPGYYQNPAAYTYVLYALLRVVYGPLGFIFDLPYGNVTEQFEKDPTEIWVAARTLAALLCMLGVAATYWAARRLWGVREGLVAAAVLSFAFLPVAYSRVAVTDVGALMGVALALMWSVRAAEDGRTRDYALAGAAAGLAISFKYTAGLVLLPLGIAALRRLRPDGPRALGGLAVGGGLTALVFVVLNPYLFGSLDQWWTDLRDQADVAANERKPGQESGGLSYYLDSLTWGLGWAGLAAALLGAVLVLRRDLWRGLILVALPLALLVYLATQSRYFGRWLLPAYPALAMLAAVGVAQAADFVENLLARRQGPRFGARRPALAGGLVVGAITLVVLAQPLAADVRSAIVLGREDTLSQARSWLSETFPPELRVSIEPAVPGRWYRSNPDGQHSLLAGALRTPRGLDRARLVLRRRGRAPGVRALQAGAVRATGRRRARLGLPGGAEPRRDRRLPPLRLLPRDDGQHGPRARPRNGRPGRARLLRAPRPRVDRPARVQPLRRRRRAGAVQLRPLVQLLPVRVPEARPDGPHSRARRLPPGIRAAGGADPEGHRAAAVRVLGESAALEARGASAATDLCSGVGDQAQDPCAVLGGS